MSTRIVPVSHDTSHLVRKHCSINPDTVPSAQNPVPSQQSSCRFAAKKQHLNCLDSSGSLLAAGGNGVVLFWDRRTAAADGQAQPMAEFSDTHEQEVTQVLLSHSTSPYFTKLPNPMGKLASER
jgi:hypothetical protein